MADDEDTFPGPLSKYDKDMIKFYEELDKEELNVHVRKGPPSPEPGEREKQRMEKQKKELLERMENQLEDFKCEKRKDREWLDENYPGGYQGFVDEYERDLRRDVEYLIARQEREKKRRQIGKRRTKLRKKNRTSDLATQSFAEKKSKIRY